MRTTLEIFQQRPNAIPANMHVSTMHWFTATPQCYNVRSNLGFIHNKKMSHGCHGCHGYAWAMAALPRRLGAAPAVGAATKASEATFRSAKLPEICQCRHFGIPKKNKLMSNLRTSRDHFYKDSDVPPSFHKTYRHIF